MTTENKSNNTRNKLASSVRRAKTTQAEKKTAATTAKTATKTATPKKAPVKKTAPVGSSDNPVKANAEKLPTTKAASSQKAAQTPSSTTTGQRVWPD
ncbi:hypothetical protein [Thiomicrospira sp. WB1]|jgi:hypothetical protein|uniref:hypothetical protein n=1 Tax=Thiomicrospira sp. WB1 TaxID=1685380 RepID=UPI00074831F3|nr:hypothetical protein [Thiomicrospira sp. WB1]KUJ72892.1 hypothetical protein AVO41_03685 [Thiomicrospira sp. WB1]